MVRRGAIQSVVDNKGGLRPEGESAYTS